jgi:hypothetical protein
MKPKTVPIEQEFDALYGYLSNAVPLLFNSNEAKEGCFAVNPNIDDEPVASFLMTCDEFNLRIPQAIQAFLRGLSHNWLVIGNFNIADPISIDGLVTKSPAFRVTKDQISGDTDMDALVYFWKDRLVLANG